MPSIASYLDWKQTT